MKPGPIIVMFASALLAQAPRTVNLHEEWRRAQVQNIRIEADQVVIEGRLGPLLLNGKSLSITADRLVLHGAAQIIAFEDPTWIPTPPAEAGEPGPTGGFGQPGGKGQFGRNGRDGKRGRNAGRLELNVKRVVGGGTLVVRNNGQAGDAGQDGGRGGSGGSGGRGDHAGQAPCYRWLSPGGRGGDGGVGGSGGRGGDGGDGGEITVSSSISSLVAEGRADLSSSGGLPGPGGLSGTGGLPGQGGDYGSPNPLSCSSMPGPLLAPSGQMGLSGRDGDSGTRGHPNRTSAAQ